MYKKIFSLAVLSCALVFSAAKDEEAAKKRAVVPLKSIEMASTPPLPEDLEFLFAPQTWGRTGGDWSGSTLFWFKGFGYDYSRDVIPQRDALEKGAHALYQRMIEGEQLEQKILPHIHRVWITSDDHPYEPPEDRIDDYLRMMDHLGEGFTSTFWCRDKSKIPHVVERLEAHGRIRVRHLKDLWDQDLRGETMYNRLYQNQLFALCSYVVRYKIINTFGGIYADFGVQIKKNIEPLLNYDSFFGQSGTLLSNRFFGAKPEDPGLNRLIQFIDLLNFAASAEMRERFKGFTSPIWVGLWALTLNHGLGRNPDDSALYLSEGSNPFYNYTGMRSWLPQDVGVERFGQRLVGSVGYDALAVFFSVKPSFDQIPVVQAWVQGKELDVGRMTKFGRIFYGASKGRDNDQQRKHILEQRSSSLRNTTEKLFRGDLTPIHYAPYNNHQMWITKDKQIPDTHITSTIHRCKSLGAGWTHILWVMDEAVLAPSIAELKEALPDLEVRQVYDYYLRRGEEPQEETPKRRMHAQGIVDGMFEHNSFVTATDIFRKVVLLDDGGFYADMGITMNCNITPLFDCAHGMFYANPQTRLFDTGVMMAAKNDPVLVRYFEVMDNIHTFDFLTTSPDNGDQIALVGQGLYNAAYAEDCGEYKVTIPLVLGQTLFNPHHMGSWKMPKDHLGNSSFGTALSKETIYSMSASCAQ